MTSWSVNFEIFDKSSVIKTKHFTIKPFVVNHSMPDCFGFELKSPNGVIVTTGDFKMDMTPVTEKSDYQKIAQMGLEEPLGSIQHSAERIYGLK